MPGDEGNNNNGAEAESEVYVSRSGIRHHTSWLKPDQDITGAGAIACYYDQGL